VDDRLDRALQQLKADAPDTRLDRLEPAVWARIEGLHQGKESAFLFLPVRAAAVFAALAFGVVMGGFGASEARAQRQEVAVFSLESRLAPSTLLEGR